MSKLLLIISGPSGCGKTTIIKKMFDRDPSFALSVSSTTRSMREGEVDGVDYYFISKEKYQDLVDKEMFVEHFQVYDNFYGTRRDQLEEKMKTHQVILDIDWQGAQKIRQIFPDALSIFILPPSMEILEERLVKRALDNEMIIRARMQKAREEIAHWGEYDMIFVNDDWEETAGKILDAIKHRQLIKRFVETKLLIVSRETK